MYDYLIDCFADYINLYALLKQCFADFVDFMLCWLYHGDRGGLPAFVGYRPFLWKMKWMIFEWTLKNYWLYPFENMLCLLVSWRYRRSSSFCWIPALEWKKNMIWMNNQKNALEYTCYTCIWSSICCVGCAMEIGENFQFLLDTGSDIKK